MQFIIVTDSCCDLPHAFVEEHHIHVMPLSIHINEENLMDNLAEENSYETFYQRMLDGAVPKTSQANVFDFKEVFLKYVKEGKAVLYLGFSSALSGCVNSAYLAKEEIEEEIKEAQITVVDTKCASMGQGLLIYYAVQAMKEGCTMAEVVEKVERLKGKINHWFTVADLKYLMRGGRISKTTATVGTLLQLKPILHVDEEGRLVAVEKVKGRKKSLKALVQKLQEKITNPEKQMIFICHAHALEEAEAVKEMIQAACPVQDIWINGMGAAVGSHAGPGTIAIFFIGESR